MCCKQLWRWFGAEDIRHLEKVKAGASGVGGLLRDSLLRLAEDPHKLNLNCFAVDWSSRLAPALLAMSDEQTARSAVRNVVTASADHTLKMWNFYGNVLRTYAGHPSEVLLLRCSNSPTLVNDTDAITALVGVTC